MSSTDGTELGCPDDGTTLELVDGEAEGKLLGTVSTGTVGAALGSSLWRSTPTVGSKVGTDEKPDMGDALEPALRNDGEKLEGNRGVTLGDVGTADGS